LPFFEGSEDEPIKIQERVLENSGTILGDIKGKDLSLSYRW